ncbi:hypothetical protein AB1Y20_015765 [Prymnesium parvum]|uniref:FAD dependent oxidoreductase domain-containing protein n=1 Tax=Prymnesium parvum TaxID=97485 RepID=A0AB34K1G3_PRYPA
MRHVAVVGGGFVGLSSALHLLRRGHRVTVIEAARVGGPQQASYGNAGCIANYAVFPVNDPSLPFRLPAMISRPHSSPFAFARSFLHLAQWATRPATLRWLALFLAHCTPAAVERSSRGLAALLAYADAGWATPLHALSAEERGWAIHGERAAPAASRLPRGCLYLFGSQEAAGADAEARRALGVACEAIAPSRVLELEPALAESRATIAAAVHFKEAWHLASPSALAGALAASVRRSAHGALVDGTRVTSIRRAGGCVALEVQPAGAAGEGARATIEFDEVVVAGGAWSAPLASTAGDHLALDTERGYHVTFHQPGGHATTPLLSRPVGCATLGFYMTPMARMLGAREGEEQPQRVLRVAGTVELGGTEAPSSPARLDLLERSAVELLPTLGRGEAGGWQRDASGDWLGFRPTTPDALPLLGRSAQIPQVIYAVGHQHLGLTLAGITGQLVADIVDGGQPSIDIAPFRPDRF